jgi:hypothetical protein
MGGVGRREGDGALFADLSGGAEVHRGGRVQPDPGVAVFVVAGGEELVGERPRACWIDPKRAGTSGVYFSVMKWASLSGG